MLALSNNLSSVQDQNQVRIHDSADPLGDDEAGAVFHQGVQGFLDLILGGQVHTAGGVIQDKDVRIKEQCTRDSDAVVFARR